MDWHNITAEAAARLKVPEAHIALRLRDGAIILYDRPTTDPDRAVLRVLPPLTDPWPRDAAAGLATHDAGEAPA